MCGQCHQLHCQLTAPLTLVLLLQPKSNSRRRRNHPRGKLAAYFSCLLQLSAARCQKLKCRVGRMGRIALTVSSSGLACGRGVNGVGSHSDKSLHKGRQQLTSSLDSKFLARSQELLWPTVSQFKQTKQPHRQQTVCA